MFEYYFLEYEVNAEATSFDPDYPSAKLLSYRFKYQLKPNGPVLTIGNDSITERPPVKLSGWEMSY